MVAMSESENISSPRMSDFSSNLGKRYSPIGTFPFNFTWDFRSRLARLWNSTVGANKSHVDDLPNGDTITEVSQILTSNLPEENKGKDFETQFTVQSVTDQAENPTDSPSPTAPKEDIVVETSGDPSLDRVLLHLLKDLPSAECLTKLDFPAFKAKVSSTRKKSVFSGGPGNSVMEPIFKKLTDEIFALQTSLSVHDQFTKASVECYQRVLLDLVVEMARMETYTSDRITRLEEQMLESRIQRALNFISDVVLLMLTWVFRKLSAAATYTAEQYPSIKEAVLTAISHFADWSISVALPHCQHIGGSIVRFGAVSLDRLISFVFGPEGLNILAIPEENKIQVKSIDEHMLDASLHYVEDGTWVFPMVPVLLLLASLRLLMCFAPSSNASKMVYWSSPARSVKLRSPRVEACASCKPPDDRIFEMASSHSQSNRSFNNSPEKSLRTRHVEVRNGDRDDIPDQLDENLTAVAVKTELMMTGQMKAEDRSPSVSDVVNQQTRQQQQEIDSPDKNQEFQCVGQGNGRHQRQQNVDASPSVVSVDSQRSPLPQQEAKLDLIYDLSGVLTRECK
jgi:hypothetical protein